MSANEHNSQRITALLQEWTDGRKEAFDELFQYVHGELHRRASRYLRSERLGHTFQTTELVNEAYINLVDKAEIHWENRNHFFAIASTAMRRILVDYARKKKSKKHGGKDEDLVLDEARCIPAKVESVDLIALDEALKELEGFDSRQAKLVELKYFGGMSLKETAVILSVSKETVKRDWRIARAWLHKRLSE